MKKLSFLSIVFLLVMILAIPTAFAAQDTSPPVLNKAELSSNTVSDGGSVRLFITATDDLSGVKYISIEGQSPSGNQVFGQGVNLKDAQGRWYADILIPKYSEPGIWVVDNISLVDGTSNRSYFYNGKQYKAEFTVISKTPDKTAPKLNKVTVDKTTINAGESFNVYVDASDDLSGIKYASISGASSTGSQVFGNGLSKDAQGRWYTTVMVSANAEAGKWTVNEVSLVDAVTNHSYFSGSLAVVNVNSPNADKVAPKLVKVEFNKAKVKAGDMVVVYVTATDDKSGVKYVSVEGESKSSNQVFGTGLNAKDINGRWMGFIKIPVNAELGTWTMHNVSLVDTAGNHSYAYGGSDFTATFEVVAK